MSLGGGTAVFILHVLFARDGGAYFGLPSSPTTSDATCPEMKKLVASAFGGRWFNNWGGGKKRMQTLTTQIKREFLAAIIAGTKTVEYREAKSYWVDRLGKYQTPFRLRLINGMNPPMPEVTVLVERVTRGAKEFRFHIAKVLSYKNWMKQR